jgi:hypothetical protein
MKIIISHDVDNLTVLEHKKDLVVYKYLLRCFIEWSNGSITREDIRYRVKELVGNKWNNIDEIIDYNAGNRIPTSFFMAVSNALGLSYSIDDAYHWIRRIKHRGCRVGLHGIEYRDPIRMESERSLFEKALREKSFGIRMHYLRSHPDTKRYLSRMGYLFDSTDYGVNDCYRSDGIWEFPIQMMDVNVIFMNKRFQTDSFAEIKRRTLSTFKDAQKKKIRFLTVNFHDRYFTSASRMFRDWYFWINEFFQSQRIDYTDFFGAIQELERRH